MTERERMIAEWERDGRLVPTCAACREFYESEREPNMVFAPNHKPSDGCKSGKRPHCACDTCF